MDNGQHPHGRLVAFSRFLLGSMSLDFGSLHQKPRVGGIHGTVRRDGSDGWRSPSLSSPADRSVHRDASFFLCVVTSSIVFWDFGSLYLKAGVPLASCCGSGNQSQQRRCGVQAADCCGSGFSMWSIAAIISAGVLYKASRSNMVVSFTIGYGDETLGGSDCFRRHLAEPKFDTSGWKIMVTEILALRSGVSLFKEYFESSRWHKTPWRICLALSLSTSSCC